MIYRETRNRDICLRTGTFNITQYFTSDVPKKYKKFLYKECKVFDNDAIIIGIEYNEVLSDEYFIIYVPKKQSVVYKLTNDAEFCKTIRL